MELPAGVLQHPINRSGERRIMVSVWDFGATQPRKERSHYLCNNHPAKMRPSLAKAILQIYGEPPVLDPMCGIGTTCVEASLLGMKSCGVEYEQKFVAQAKKNIQHLKKLHPDKRLGEARIIKGDARLLSKLFKKKAGSILLSPPYFDAIKKGGEGPQATNRRIAYEERVKRFKGYSTDKNNIGNIGSYGFGSILFSPPYFNTRIDQHNIKISTLEKACRELGLKDFRDDIKKVRRWLELNARWGDGRYSRNKENIGNLGRYGVFNSILFSPPYGEANRGGGIAKKGYEGRHGKDTGLKDRCDRPLSDDPANLSNTRYGRTYLGEMLKVYSECYKVLKPGKFMVVVVKDIRRKGLCIPIGCDTIKLCQLAGFDLFEVIINKLYSLSFWQINLAKKDQEKGVPHPLKTHEYVLVFKKPKL
jgi:DNA modification methylase